MSRHREIHNVNSHGMLNCGVGFHVYRKLKKGCLGAERIFIETQVSNINTGQCSSHTLRVEDYEGSISIQDGRK